MSYSSPRAIVAVDPERASSSRCGWRRAGGAVALVGALFALGSGAASCVVEAPVDNQAEYYTEHWTPAAVGEDNLRVVTFNIRNYPFWPVDSDADPKPPPISYSLETDREALLTVLAKLDFDVMAVQEIIDPAAFTTVVADLAAGTGRAYEWVHSANENGNPQHLGVVVDTGRVQLAWSREHPQIDLSGRLRPGFSVRIESLREDGIDFGLMVLHLASGSSQKRAELRASQAAMAAAVVAEEIVETADPDYLVVGDLNTAREPEELVGLDAAFATGTELLREDNPAGCTSYWIKKSTNPLLRPSWLDHVYVSSLEEVDRAVPIVSGTHCAERRCEQFESTDAITGSTFYGVSDHCPVYFELLDADVD